MQLYKCMENDCRYYKLMLFHFQLDGPGQVAGSKDPEKEKMKKENCDEIWIEGKIAEKMERIYRKGSNPTRRITLPVWSLSKVA